MISAPEIAFGIVLAFFDDLAADGLIEQAEQRVAIAIADGPLKAAEISDEPAQYFYLRIAYRPDFQRRGLPSARAQLGAVAALVSDQSARLRTGVGRRPA